MAQYLNSSPLTRWLNGAENLTSYVTQDRFIFKNDNGNFLAIEKRLPIHRSAEVPAQSLENSWFETHSYLSQAMKLIHKDVSEKPEDVFIDNEDRRRILYELGEPPKPCLPIYMFSIADDINEKILYIGKTDSNKARFTSGHHILTKMLDPKYDSYAKYLYLCSVMLLNDDGEYLPLEWVKPYSLAAQILDDYESQLIFNLQPELNIKKRNTDCAINPLIIQIVNYSKESQILNDVMLFPRKK